MYQVRGSKVATRCEPEREHIRTGKVVALSKDWLLQWVNSPPDIAMMQRGRDH